MNALVPLHFNTIDVRMIVRDGEPWWVGDDVARSLDLANPRQVLSRLEDYEKGVQIVDTLGGPQSVTIINESGFYSLLLTSRKPVAKAMKRWLTTEVLPSIRKHGCYPPPAEQAFALPAPEPLRAPEGSTRQQRFVEECVRLAAENEFGTNKPALIEMMKHIVSEARMKSMFRGDGNVLKLLAHDNTFEALLGFGFDLQYVVNGLYTLTPTERSMRDRYRSLPPEQRGKVWLALPRGD